ncbi:uncharacterized protein LY89DRAFT_24224 [Mollisia scopiformis]|uniref:BTB domain-containing protein n=1 Tax=Mollisia scopiformis TaxID=149040 RepID=A0A194XW53_MOLSC|nr:uncharacterized protein LY89DRAFT_24224 [Mollisia scopiformis]KUJ24535.1 hypothetical protein LY89DRAFT_24224 [Mollisia scopiformis]
MSLVRQRSTDPASSEEPATKKPKTVPEFPWPWNDPPETDTYIDKIKSPILDIRVGPDAKLFQVHKRVLTDKADFFGKMFDGQFIEAAKKAADFPEDDEAAWEELIAWSYGAFFHVFLPCDRRRVNLDAKEALAFFNRIKLCCLAEKYNIIRLYNLGVDSLIDFLWQGPSTMPILSWDVFQVCCRYAYEHSAEHTGLRHLFSTYFCYLLSCPKEDCESTYDSQQMMSLASDIPDLMSDFFKITQQSSGPDSTKPDNIDPCVFHMHIRPANEECPRALGGCSSFKWPRTEAQVHYSVQGMYEPDMSQGCRVMRLAEVIGVATKDVISAVDSLIKDVANVEWLDEGHNVDLINPKKWQKIMEHEQEE